MDTPEWVIEMLLRLDDTQQPVAPLGNLEPTIG